MNDHASGGLSAELRRHVIDAASALLVDPVIATSCPHVSDSLLNDMMSACMGEVVPREYSGMMREELGFEQRMPEWRQAPVAEALNEFSVLIIGAGASGICMGIGLQRLGIPFEILEKNCSIGGTWLENRYPGCGVDTPSHLYSYSFARKNWSRYFARQDEILSYVESCAHRFGILPNITLGATVEDAQFDDETATWKITVKHKDGTVKERRANVLISAVGQLNQPFIPAIDGYDRFAGRAIHSARWRSDIETAGARIAVIGTGATAMQLVPALAQEAEHITVFQRSAPWIAPSENYLRNVPDGVRLLMRHVPLYAAWYRFRLAWSYSDKVHESLHIDPDWTDIGRSINTINDAHRRFFTHYLEEQLGDRADLVEQLLPQYPPFAKRMLLDNNWFETMRRPNVSLVEDKVARISEAGVVDATGREHRADLIVYATGFRTLDMLASLNIRGAEGRVLRDEWGEDDARAYLGITVPGFPNFYCLYGPNTGLGHGGSLIFLTECAVRYVLRILQQQLASGWRSVECRREKHKDYNALLEDAHARMVWSHPGASNWYRNKNGRVVTNWPWRVVDYWSMTREPDFADFVIEE